LFSGVAGVALDGALNAITSRYATFKEAQGIAAGLETEVASIARLVQLRNYPAWIDRIISRLEQPDYQPKENDFFSPQVTAGAYFRVFTSTCSRIGLLGEAVSPTVRAYLLAQSVIEDIQELKDDRRRVEEGRRFPNREGLLGRTLELKAVLRLAFESVEEAVRALHDFQCEWWISPRRRWRKVRGRRSSANRK
jgi:hypothetical protein